MKNEKSGISRKIAFIGGDSRILAAAGTLAAEENAECAVFGFEKYKTKWTLPQGYCHPGLRLR